MCEPDGQAFSDRMFAAEDGLRLHLRDYDPGPDATGSRLPIICLAGPDAQRARFPSAGVDALAGCQNPKAGHCAGLPGPRSLRP